MYKILCNYGTRKTEWTLKGAKAWLPYCGTAAIIQNRITKKIVLRRVTTETTSYILAIAHLLG